MFAKKVALNLFLFMSFMLFAHADTGLNLRGFLGKEEVTRAIAVVESLASKPPQSLIIEVSSSSGDLSQIIELAKAIYEVKRQSKLKVIVYIDDNAVGPAAIIPFLADELYSSIFVSWGDIPFGSEGTLPANILRNRVRSLIDQSNPKAVLLEQLADAMSDPSLNGKDIPLKTLSASGQTLVINHNQLKELNLAKGIMPLADFKKLFPLSQEKVVIIEKPPATPLEEQLRTHIKYNAKGTNPIGLIQVTDRDGSINESTWLYVKKALDSYKETKPIFIILELNTPGGEVFAAEKIANALKEMDTQNKIPVVAFINNWAISAGALLAYSSRFIAAAKDASMGAAEPVIASQATGKMESASEKVNSAIRTDFASQAAFFGREPLIAEAMVDKDIILVWRHGKVVKLDAENQIRLSGPEPDVVISPKGKLLTLTAEQMIQYGVANILLEPKALVPITSEEKAAGEWPASKTLLFQEPFFAAIPNAVIKPYQMDWKTHFFVLLATPMISSLLFMGLIIGAYIEFNHPGVSLPGIVAGACLFLIVLSSFSLELGNWLELIILLTGVILILVELFVVPTFGFLGVIGILMFLGGLLAMMLPGLGSVSFDYDSKTLNAAGVYFMNRLAWISGALILSMIAIIFLARYVLPAFSGFNPFILQGHEQEGYIASTPASELPQPGKTGEVFATLRPAGKVIIDGEIYDAMTSGGYIEKGEPIVVVRLEGSVIIVNTKGLS